MYTRKKYSIWSKEMCPENKSRHNPPFSSYRVRKSMLLWEELRCLIYPVCCCLCVWCSLWAPPLTLGGLAYVGFIKLPDTRRTGKRNRDRKKSVWVCAFFLLCSTQSPDFKITAKRCPLNGPSGQWVCKHMPLSILY